MKRLEMYVAKTILASISMVVLILTGLQIFIVLVKQLGDLGKGSYGIVEVCWFVLGQLPYEVYLFFPMACLMGCLIGLGVMASHRELVVMRSAGLSIWQITLSVFKAAVLIIIVVTALGETIIPQLMRTANDNKLMALSDGQTLRTAKGVWLRVRNDFITVGEVVSNRELRRVYQFRFDASHHLKLSRRIGKIHYSDGIWKATHIQETVINETHTQARKVLAMDWDVKVKPAIFNTGNNVSSEMTLHELWQFLRAKKAAHQQALGYELNYWQRIFQPLTTLVMMMIAIPFIFGPLRDSTMGSKLLVGAAVGFGFSILNRFFGPLSLVLQWPPVLCAIIPTILFSLLGIYLMRRQG